MLVALENCVDWPGCIQEVHLIDIEIVIGKDLALIYVLILFNLEAIEVERELLPILLLDLLHLSVVAKRQVVQGVREIELAATHVELLNDLAESMRGEVEVPWDLVDDDSTLHLATFLLIHCLDRLIINLIHALACVLEMRGVIHDIMHADVIAVLI